MNNNNLLFFDIFITILIIGTFTFIKNQSDYSEIEKRHLDKIPHFYISDYIKGKYQTKLENALSDQFPYSENIRTNYNKYYNISKYIKDKICIDTYINIGNNRSIYGCSEYIIFNSFNQFITEDKTTDFFEMYNKLNEISDVYYYIIDTSFIMDFNTNKYTYNLSKIYQNNLKGNYTLSSFKINSFKEYSKYFYKTDHHWNYKGSYKGYIEIMKMFKENNILKPKSTITFNNIKFYGSHSQQTRYYDSYDIFSMYRFDIPTHETYIDKEKRIYGSLDKNIKKEKKSKNSLNMYIDYYGNDFGEIIFNFNNPEKDNLLIISNSFDNPIDELIATHFNKTYILDPRYYKDIDNLNLKDYLKDNNIEKVLVISDYFYLNDNIMIRLEEE